MYCLNKCCKLWLLLTVFYLAACHDTAPLDESKLNLEVASKNDVDDVVGGKLSKVAAHAVNHNVDENNRQGSEAAQKFVGRYALKITCPDRFIGCDEGSANVVMTLLADGAAQLTVVHLGKVTFSSKMQKLSEHWTYDDAGQHIVLYRDNGVEFFYDIVEQQNLQLNLAKTRSAPGQNQRYFAEGHAFPESAYVFKKVS